MQTKPSYQLLVLIATPKLVDKAAGMFLKEDLPVQFRFRAAGTAPSEIMDALGLGSVEKRGLISPVPAPMGRRMLEMLHTELRLDAVNSGIAFTLPLTGATRLVQRMMDHTEENNQFTEEEGENGMKDSKYTLIAAIVEQGYTGEVMDAAKSAGAGGGTVVHSRSIENAEAAGFWGLSVQEEKEIVLILAKHKDKVQIMSAIGEKCGMQTEARGLVVSLPIDSVMGI